MRPSAILKHHRHAILEATRKYPVGNARVFGSTLTGTDREGSDLDILVEPLPETTLLDLGGLQDELEEITGVQVDLLTPGDLPETYRRSVLESARSL